MATKAQRARAEEERARAIANTNPERPKPDVTTNESDRAGKKATYAFEEQRGGRSRKSTRKSANRAKPDAGMNIREELRRNAPKERHGRAATRP